MLFAYIKIVECYILSQYDIEQNTDNNINISINPSQSNHCIDSIRWEDKGKMFSQSSHISETSATE